MDRSNRTSKKRPTKAITHSDVNAAARVAQALQLRLLGFSYARIASQVGYGSRASAFNAIQRELQRQIAPASEDVRVLEIARLDQLLTVFYEKAFKGDGWSLDRVLRIMERRAAYLGLDVLPGSHGAGAQLTLISVPEDVALAV